MGKALVKPPIAEQVKDLIANSLCVEDDQVTPGSSLAEDLGADFLDIVGLVMLLEEKFEITISEEQGEKFKTVGDIIKYVERTQRQ